MPKHKQRRSTRTIKLDDPNVSYRIETDRGVITVYPTTQGPSLDIYVDAQQHKANETFLQIWRRNTGEGVGHVCGVDDQGIQVRLRSHGSLSYGEVRDNPGLRKFYNRAIGKPDDFMLDSEKAPAQSSDERRRQEFNRAVAKPEPPAVIAARHVTSMLHATTTVVGKSLYARAQEVIAAYERQEEV